MISKFKGRKKNRSNTVKFESIRSTIIRYVKVVLKKSFFVANIELTF